jgi:hypothetical protein
MLWRKDNMVCSFLVTHLAPAAPYYAIYTSSDRDPANQSIPYKGKWKAQPIEGSLGVKNRNLVPHPVSSPALCFSDREVNKG